jgi:hypothetical protein
MLFFNNRLNGKCIVIVERIHLKYILLIKTPTTQMALWEFLLISYVKL